MVGAPARPLDVVVQEPGGGFPPNVDATVLEPGVGVARPAAAAPASAVVEPPGATVVLAMPRLVIMTDEKPGTEHVLKAGITVLGRSPKSDIQIPFSEVSRKHAEIVWEADGYIILDLGSENGVLVNGQRVKKHVLSDGDVVQIGPQKLIFKA
jgi:pSer/pThr/pTyr-binding forkhead associated (FHA) protein